MKTKKHRHTRARTIEICECGAVRERGGEWGKLQGSWVGRAMVHNYIDSTTPEERSEHSKRAAETRWKGRKKERKTFMTEIAKLPRPSRFILDRCPCGKFSRKLAEKRGHKCVAPAQPAPPEEALA